MALTKDEQVTVAALIAKEGGLAPFTAEVLQVHAAVAQDAATHALEKSALLTVLDWKAIEAYVAGATNSALYALTGSITKAVAAQDETQLGALLVALYGAVKRHLSL